MIAGRGIHSGESVRVRLHREEGPLRFRIGRTLVPARLENVVSTELCTVLGAEGATVATVEHLLAALQLSGFWRDVLVEVDGPEIPILDGSAQPWLEPIEALGRPPAAPLPRRLTTPVTVVRGSARVEARPGRPALIADVDYPHPAIGRQRWSGPAERWRELLSARTFGFLSDLERLEAAGRARGAGIENAIVFDESRPLSQLRFPDEPVRHKALDFIGDLTLLGQPLQAEVTVVRGSHRLHLEFMRNLVAANSEAEANR